MAKHLKQKGIVAVMLETAIKTGKRLAQQHLIDGSSGNLSFRHGLRITITKTGAMLDSLKPDDFIEVEIGKKDSKASSDLKVHQQIYEKSEYKAIIHCHGSYNIALSFVEDEIVPVDLEGTLFLKKIRFIEDRFGSDGLAKRIAKDVKERGFAIVRGHGIYTAGMNFDEALKMAGFVEHSCKVYYLTKLFSLLDRR